MERIVATITIIGFIIGILIQVGTVGVFIGIYKSTIAFMQQQIEEIKNQAKEDKQELKNEMCKYNNVLSRMAVAENSIRSCHHRVDTLEGKPYV